MIFRFLIEQQFTQVIKQLIDQWLDHTTKMLACGDGMLSNQLLFLLKDS